MTVAQAVSGIRRAMRERVDGTLIVQIEIDPPQRGAFLTLFPEIDMPVALAPLVPDHRRRDESNTPPQQAQAEAGKPVPGAASAAPAKPKVGALCLLAVQLCQNPEFREFIEVTSEHEAVEHIYTTCGIESRTELDHDTRAAEIFHREIREPWLAYREAA